MFFKRFAILALAGLSLLATSASAGDAKVYPGMGCQLSAGASSLDEYVRKGWGLYFHGASLGAGGRRVDIVCPVPRDVLGRNISYLQLDVYAGRSADRYKDTDFICNVQRSTPGGTLDAGTPDTILRPGKTGHHRIVLPLLPRVSADDTFGVYCSVPEQGRIHGYRAVEG